MIMSIIIIIFKFVTMKIRQTIKMLSTRTKNNSFIKQLYIRILTSYEAFIQLKLQNVKNNLPKILKSRRW